MSRNEKQTTSGGVGFFGILGIAFIVLKLCGVIDWAWWVILLPIYAPIALAIILFLIACGVSKYE